MIEHVYRRAATAARVNAVMVATDDPRISDVVSGFGGEVRLTDPKHRSGTERLAEVAADLSCDLIVNVQGDEPLISPEAIDLALAAFEDQPELMMSTLRTPITDPDELANPNTVKVVVDRDGFALYFSRQPIPHRMSAEAASNQSPSSLLGNKHIGLYVYRRDFLVRLAALDPTPLEQVERLEQLRALEHGYRIQTVETTDDPIGVDTPEDLERVRRIVEDPPR
jgi:3-deoxy-manno-octulosonate cytidylyltransferase (CMP-KDO synthetase)